VTGRQACQNSAFPRNFRALEAPGRPLTRTLGPQPAMPTAYNQTTLLLLLASGC